MATALNPTLLDRDLPEGASRTEQDFQDLQRIVTVLRAEIQGVARHIDKLQEKIVSLETSLRIQNNHIQVGQDAKIKLTSEIEGLRQENAQFKKTLSNTILNKNCNPDHNVLLRESDKLNRQKQLPNIRLSDPQTFSQLQQLSEETQNLDLLRDTHYVKIEQYKELILKYDELLGMNPGEKHHKRLQIMQSFDAVQQNNEQLNRRIEQLISTQRKLENSLSTLAFENKNLQKRTRNNSLSASFQLQEELAVEIAKVKTYEIEIQTLQDRLASKETQLLHVQNELTQNQSIKVETDKSDPRDQLIQRDLDIYKKVMSLEDNTSLIKGARVLTVPIGLIIGGSGILLLSLEISQSKGVTTLEKISEGLKKQESGIGICLIISSVAAIVGLLVFAYFMSKEGKESQDLQERIIKLDTASKMNPASRSSASVKI